MGLDINGTRFLLYCKRLGVDFARTAMIGRQGLHLSKRDLMHVLESFGYLLDAREIDSILTQHSGYAEPLLVHLGAEEVHSFDNSEYENATHLHDMNRELPDRFKEQYTTVLDGGSLEHIFNFPIAIKNCMEMVCIGGYYLSITPTNNFVGHGFYQFSPELYFSVFTRDNGFELMQVIAFEDKPHAKWYFVKSPIEAKSRVTLTNRVPTYLLIIARKIASTQIFKTIPQQSDYLAIWHEKSAHLEGDQRSTPAPDIKHTAYLQFVKRIVPGPVKRLISGMLLRRHSCFSSPFTPAFFSPLDPTADVGRPSRSSGRPIARR